MACSGAGLIWQHNPATRQGAAPGWVQHWLHRRLHALVALLMALMLGLYTPLFCILHCQLEPLSVPASSPAPTTALFFCHAPPPGTTAQAVSPLLPQPIYPLALVSLATALAPLLLVLVLHIAARLSPHQWVAAPLTPPPR